MNQPELILKFDATLGESPLWSIKEKALYWVDILACKIHRFDPKTSINATFQLNEPVTALGFTTTSKLILALENRVALFDLESHVLNEICAPEIDQKRNRFNDGKCDRQGRFFCGTMNREDPQADTGKLFRIDINHSPILLQNAVKETNGMGWSPDNKIMYFTETGRYQIFAYDFDESTGNVSNRRVFVSIDPYPDGGPDGLTVDSAGFVWSAHYGKGEIVRYDPKGKMERTLKLPVPKVTSCMFGGDDLETLFITTAREKMTQDQIDEFPLSGSLFAYQSGVKGLPEGFYKG